MSKPRISVCLPNYNHGRFLRAGIQALLAQSLPPFEIIIVDDASTDDSVAIIEELAQSNDTIKLLRNPVNQGCCRSVNRALAESSGEYVFITASDDLVLPGYFEKTASCLRRYPSAGVCVTHVRYIDRSGNSIAYKKLLYYNSQEGLKIPNPLFLRPPEVQARIRRQPWFIYGGPSPIYRRDVLLEAGGWHAELGPYTDWFVIHFAALKYGMVYLPEPLVAFRIVPGGFGDAARRPREAIEKLGKVLALMENEKWSDVFPADFTLRKRREFAYYAFSGSFVGAYRDFRNELDDLMPETSGTDRALLRLFKLSLDVQKLILKVYCMRKSHVIYPQITGHRNW